MNEKKHPVRKVKCGKISISLWRHEVTSANGASFEHRRACVQHSRKDRDTGDWHNQQIWLNIDELRDLSSAVDQLNEARESPSSLLDLQKQTDAKDLYMPNDSLSMRRSK